MRRRPWLPATALLAVLAAALPCPVAQEEEDLTAGLREIREAYDSARARSDNLDFSGAVAELDVILDARGAERPADMSLEELQLVSAAYFLRARSYFNMGETEKARRDFETLLEFAPGYRIDRETLSPKVVDLFDRVRARMVGILSLQVDPGGARVLVDDLPVEPAALEDIALLAGEHQLRVEMEGYEPYVATFTARVGAVIQTEVSLRPNRRALEFITVPAGTTVSLDGTPVGTTSGPATADVVALAEDFEFDPAEASAPLRVPLVTPGEHRVVFEHECYRTRKMRLRVDLDLEQNLPLRLAPVVLKEAWTDLRVTSVPSGAEVMVDGVARGKTPLTISSLCSGERDVSVVKRDVGSWSERIRLQDTEINALDVRLRPTLLYAGTFRLDEWGRAVWSDEDAPLLEEFARGLDTLNMVRSTQVLEEVREAVIAWMISDPARVRDGTLLPPEVLRRAADRGGADLVLAGLTEANDPERKWTLALYSVLHQRPDIVRLTLDDAGPLKRFVKRLDSTPPTTEPWWGMGLADTLLEPEGQVAGGAAGERPVIARVLPGSPAARAGLRVGDRIKMIQNRDVEDVGDLTQAVATEMAGSSGRQGPLDITVIGAAGERTIRLAPGRSPVIVPLSDPGILYNRALAEYRLRARASSDELEHGAARLNLGLAFMHFHAYDKALSQGFARASLPAGSGISEGTLDYYRGVCALRRDDLRAARTAFEAAARATGSTLVSGDGPSAAAAARRMLAAME